MKKLEVTESLKHFPELIFSEHYEFGFPALYHKSFLYKVKKMFKNECSYIFYRDLAINILSLLYLWASIYCFLFLNQSESKRAIKPILHKSIHITTPLHLSQDVICNFSHLPESGALSHTPFNHDFKSTMVSLIVLVLFWFVT